MKKSNTKIILIIVLILLIALGGAAFCVFKTDMFKSPEQLFKKYLANNVTQIEDFNFEPFNKIFERMETESSSTKLNIEYKDSYSEETMKLAFNVKSDFQNKAGLINIKANMGEYNDDASLYYSNNKLGLQTDLLHEKYLIIENRDLKELAKKFGFTEDQIEEIPDKISDELLNITENEEKIAKINELQTKYINRFFEQITEDKFSIEKKVQTEVNGNSITTNKYSVNLTDKELATMLSTTLKELANDPELLSLNTENSEELEKAIDEFKEELDDFDKSIEKMEEKPWVLSVYESGKKVVKTEVVYDEINISLFVTNNEIKILINSKEENSASILINNNFNNGTGELSFTVRNEKDNEEVMKIVLNSTESGDVTTTKLRFEGEDFKEINDALSISMDYEFGSNATVKNVDEDNSIILNDVEEEDLEALVTEISENMLNNSEKSLLGYYINLYSNSRSSSLDNYDYYDNNSYSNNTEDSDNYEDVFSAFEGTSSGDVESEKAEVESTVEMAMQNVLREYRTELSFNSDADPAEFLNENNIKSHCDGMDIQIVDGSTLKTEIDGNVYYTKIYVNGENWTLDGVETFYSEDGVNY